MESTPIRVTNEKGLDLWKCHTPFCRTVYTCQGMVELLAAHPEFILGDPALYLSRARASQGEPG